MTKNTKDCTDCELNIHSHDTPLEQHVNGCRLDNDQTIPLVEGRLDKEYSILCNNIQKYIELGMYHGNTVKIIKNDHSDRNLIIAVGESRYILSKNIAQNIMVRET